MDANGSRYHALVTAADWLACLPSDVPSAVPPATPPRLAWNDAGLLVLRPLLFEFKPAKAGLAALPEPGSRAGGVFDAYGNLYALAADGLSLRIRSSGSGAISTFWPLAEACGALVAGHGLAPSGQGVGTVFAPLPPDVAVPAPVLDALAVTTGHYLVAASGAASGLLIFDLHGGGPPLFQSWPAMPAPQALMALDDGGLALLCEGWLHRLGADLKPCLPVSGAVSAFSEYSEFTAATGFTAPAEPPCRLDLRPALGENALIGACALLPRRARARARAARGRVAAAPGLDRSGWAGAERLWQRRPGAGAAGLEHADRRGDGPRPRSTNAARPACTLAAQSGAGVAGHTEGGGRDRCGLSSAGARCRRRSGIPLRCAVGAKQGQGRRQQQQQQQQQH